MIRRSFVVEMLVVLLGLALVEGGLWLITRWLQEAPPAQQEVPRGR